MDITLSQAQKIIEAAADQCQRMGLRMSFAVVDSKRDLVATARMDGAMPFTPDVARGKAMLSVIFQQPTSELVERGSRQVMQAVNQTQYGGRLVFASGGLPIFAAEGIIGAVGASGATGEQDEEAATAGLAALTG